MKIRFTPGDKYVMRTSIHKEYRPAEVVTANAQTVELRYTDELGGGWKGPRKLLVDSMKPDLVSLDDYEALKEA